MRYTRCNLQITNYLHNILSAAFGIIVIAGFCAKKYRPCEKDGRYKMLVV